MLLGGPFRKIVRSLEDFLKCSFSYTYLNLTSIELISYMYSFYCDMQYSSFQSGKYLHTL